MFDFTCRSRLQLQENSLRHKGQVHLNRPLTQFAPTMTSSINFAATVLSSLDRLLPLDPDMRAARLVLTVLQPHRYLT